MGMFVFIALLAMLASAAIAVIVGVRASARKQLTSAARPQLSIGVAAQLDVLDQRLASGQLSQADYTALRNGLLGLPPPEQR